MVRQIKKRGNRKKNASVKPPASAHTPHILRCIVSLLIVMTVVGALTLLAGTPSKNLIERSPAINTRYPAMLKQVKPQVVFLGK
jgi:hypothetical protein